MTTTTTLCNLGTGSGLRKLNEYHHLKQQLQRVFKRSYQGYARLPCLSCAGGKVYIRNCRRKFEFRQWQHCGQSFIDDKASYSNTTHDKEEDNTTLIWRAIKLPIYSVALVPLTVGSAAAYLQTGIFSVRHYSILLVSSVLIITWLNLSNDVYDFDTGADKNKKESVVNLVGSRTGTLVAACLLLGLGFLGLVWVSLEAGSMRAILLLACAIVCGYIYQCPPFRLSYQGLGEPLCFAAFGPFASTAFYLLQGNTREIINLPFTGSILATSLLIGLTTTLILFCSHFHQIEGDRNVKKMSPLVRLGTERGAGFVKLAIIALYGLTVTFGLSGCLPFTSIFLCGLTLPVARMVVSYVQKNHNDKHKIFMAKYYCVRLHSLFGAALAAGFVLGRMAPKISIPRSGFLWSFAIS